jgi:hypothetical protein
MRCETVPHLKRRLICWLEDSQVENPHGAQHCNVKVLFSGQKPWSDWQLPDLHIASGKPGRPLATVISLRQLRQNALNGLQNQTNFINLWNIFFIRVNILL